MLNRKNEPNVFCIGHAKTGTSSLFKALKILRYNVIRLPYLNIWEKQNLDRYVKKLRDCNYDAFADYPIEWRDGYKKIDELIPNSKFILTIRDKQSLGRSYKNYFRKSLVWNANLSKLVKIINRYEKRNEEIIEYFNGRPDQLLIINITEGDGWKELCTFLDKPIPNEPFPHKNKGKYKNGNS